jgi:hypothetical protein
MRSISHLPSELLISIFDMVSASDDTSDELDAQSALNACTQVSKDWNRLATPILYRHPQCRRDAHLKSLLNTIQQAHQGRAIHEYTQLIQRFSFGHFMSRTMSDSHVREMMEHCGPSMRWINLGVHPSGLTHQSLLHIAKLCPNLQSIYLSDLADQPRLTDDAVQTLFTHCQSLREVGLYRCGFMTDDALIILAKNGHLKHLALFDCHQVSQRGIDGLLEHGGHLEQIYITSRSLRESPVLHALASRCRKAYICIGDGSGSTVSPLAEGIARSKQVRLIKNADEDRVRIELTTTDRRSSGQALFG